MRVTLLIAFFCLFSFAVGPSNLSLAGNRQCIGTTGYGPTVKQKKKTTSSRPAPEAIWKGIKVAAENEVRANSPLIIVPKFTITEAGSSRQLTIVKGDVTGPDFGGDPYGVPFKKQVLIEALRRALLAGDTTLIKATKTSPGSRESVEIASDWRRYLLDAENLVKKAVVEIESEQDKIRLAANLRELEKQIDDILYDKIYQAVEQFAERNKYNIIYGRGGGNPKKFSVNITTFPDGAKVLMMPDLIYRKQIILKTNRSQWPWIEIVQNPYQLVGKYRYFTIWPDGKQAEGNIDIVNDSPVRFLAN